MEEVEQNQVFRAVVNDEDQYSIWPAYKENPPGWRDAGMTGTKQECLEYIKQIWTDMRPLSVRQQMAKLEAESKSKTAE